jgi:recombinational DNA repair protein RecR
MNNKREARSKYYQGLREAMVEHIKTTEQSLRKLPGIEPAKLEKITLDLQKQHEKLLKRIDRHIEENKIREKV